MNNIFILINYVAKICCQNIRGFHWQTLGNLNRMKKKLNSHANKIVWLKHGFHTIQFWKLVVCMSKCCIFISSFSRWCSVNGCYFFAILPISHHHLSNDMSTTFSVNLMIKSLKFKQMCYAFPNSFSCNIRRRRLGSGCCIIIW